MANETLGLILPDLQYEDPQDIVAGQQMRQIPLGEYLGAKTGEAFEMSVPGMLSQEQRILQKELDDQRSIYEKRLTREDWEASPWHRKGIEWNEEFTPARAQVIAEDFDSREYRKSLIDRSPFGFRSVLGFGASMVGTALDPVNYLPVFGPAAKAKAIMRLGEIGGQAAMTAAEAAIQTGITDVAVFNRLNKQGEDLGWLDGALDVTFGAAVGGLFGAGSGALHKMRVEGVRRRLPMPMREEFGLAMEKALADQAAGHPVDVGDVLQAFSRNADFLKTLADGLDGEVESPVKAMLRDSLATREDLSPEQVDAYFKVTDAAARSWGETYGRNPAEWYGEVLGGVEPHALDVPGTVGERLNQGKIIAADTTTPEFREWFGASKVVDESGAPLTVYKAMPAANWETGEPFTEINRKSEFPAFNRGEPGIKISGFFSSDPEVANRFTKMTNPPTPVYPTYLSFQTPHVIDAGGEKAGNIQFGESGKAFRDAVRSGNYDGVIIKNTADEGDVYVALKPEQIKSVFNRGTWDPNDPNILRQTSKGAVTFDEANRAFVELFKTADFSTLVHETGHILRRTLSDADKAIAESAFKVADGKWTRDAEEAFAGAFERYLTEGVAPTKALQGVFDKIKSWMLAIYKTLKNAGEDIPDDIRGVFDRLLSTERERQIDFARERPADIPVEMAKANPAGPDESPIAEAVKSSKAAEPKPGEAKGSTNFEAGLLPEEVDAIRRAQESGTLHPDDAQAMIEAERFTDTMDKYADAYLAAADCIMR